MDKEPVMKMQEQMDKLTEALTEMGVAYELHNGNMVSFSNGVGVCYVFPSQTYDGKILVRYTSQARVESAIDALIKCGVLRDDVE